MTSKDTPSELLITLRILPREAGDEYRRLRAALKCLKRGYGLQCVAITQAKAGSATLEEKGT